MPYKDKAKRIACVIESRRRRLAAMTPEQRAEHYRSFPSRKPEGRRREHLKGRYGLTLEQWEMMFAAQGRCCAICGSTISGWKRGWHTDHDHETGKIRAILCHLCNRTLGHMKDDPMRFHDFIGYLSKHSHVPTWISPGWSVF